MSTNPTITFALNKNNELVHISDVPRGLACNCTCPACHERLLARKGSKNEHSFAHLSGKACEAAFETTLHLLAKKIIREEPKILLPPLFNKKSTTMQREYFEKIDSSLKEPVLIKADSADIEKKIGDFIPDILLLYNTTPLIVEICVTHPVDDIKLEKIKKTGINAVEFDLRDIDRYLDKEGMKEILASGEYCYWIYNKTKEEEIKKYNDWLENKKKEQEAELKHTEVYTGIKTETQNIFDPICQKYPKFWSEQSSTIKNYFCITCLFYETIGQNAQGKPIKRCTYRKETTPLNRTNESAFPLALQDL